MRYTLSAVIDFSQPNDGYISRRMYMNAARNAFTLKTGTGAGTHSTLAEAQKDAVRSSRFMNNNTILVHEVSAWNNDGTAITTSVTPISSQETK